MSIIAQFFKKEEKKGIVHVSDAEWHISVTGEEETLNFTYSVLVPKPRALPLVKTNFHLGDGMDE